MATVKSGEHSNKTIVLLLLSHLFTCSATAVTSRLDSPSYCCTSPGDTLIYNCTVVGGGSTLWTGRDFDCPSTNNEIVLLHSDILGEIGDCSNGSIVGRGVREDPGNSVFVSQLSVLVTLNSAGATVKCTYNSGASSTLINSSTISLISEPDNVTLLRADCGLITFSWSPVDCPLSYRISSTCGDCPSATNNTNVDCSVTDLSTEDIACEFGVQSVACGSFVSTSNKISLNVNAPNVPDILNVLPVYYVNSTLKRVQVQFSESTSFNIYDGVDGSAKEYNISYFVGTSSSSCYSAIVPASSCANGVCNHSFTVSSSCLSSADISVAVFATNVLGDSPSSIPFTTRVVNDFVTVDVNAPTNTINCTFLTGMSASEKHCSVVYGPCSQSPTQSAQASVNGSTNTILLTLEFIERKDYCYSVSAGNDDYTLQIEGIIKIGNGGNTPIIIGVVVPVIIVVVIGSIAAVFVVIYIIARRCQSKGTDNNKRIDMTNPFASPKPLSDERHSNIVKLDVDSPCELKDFVEKVKALPYKRGCVFYECNSEFEDITDNQEVILFKETPDTAYGFMLYDGSSIKKARPSEKLFVQYIGSGARYLHPGSCLLYEKNKEEMPYDDKLLVKVQSDLFEVSKVDKNCTLEDFCKDKKIDHTKFNAFPETSQFGDTFPSANVRDAMLSKKIYNEKHPELYTGPKARLMVRGPTGKMLNDHEWIVFGLVRPASNAICLTEGTRVLHQKPISDSTFEMEVLTVGDTCVQLADFLVSKGKCRTQSDFKCDRVFYEFTRDEEDLDYYRDVIIVNRKDEAAGRFLTTTNNSGVECFYHGYLQTPGVAVKKPQLSLKMLIQCVQVDKTRCLKPGTIVLYKATPKQQTDMRSNVANAERIQTEDNVAYVTARKDLGVTSAM